jgi:hypothetical protein
MNRGAGGCSGLGQTARRSPIPGRRIPTDVVLCPWHYEVREHHESVPMLMSKGLRVMPTSWNNTEATLALIRDAKKNAIKDRLVGHVFVTWSQPREHWDQYESLVKGLAVLRERPKTTH